MAAVTCSYCGLPFQVRRVEPGRPVYCCAGCALASRVRVEGGEFPITPELLLALGAGLAAFNQALAWLLAVLLAQEDKVEMAARLEWVSLGAGAVAWLVAAVAHRRSGVAGGREGAVAGLTLMLVASGWVFVSPACALAGVAGWLTWVARGAFRRRAGPRR